MTNNKHHKAMTTTLDRIKDNHPCGDGWRKLIRSLNKTKADDASVSIRHIIESNGIADAIWALRAVDGHDREIRLYVAWCAEQVLPIYEKEYPNDNRPRLSIQAAKDYANGLIDDAARAAARASAESATLDATSDSARAAARAAARSAAIGAAIGAKDGAARAASALDAAAWDTARQAQKTELIRVCECVEKVIDPYPTNPA